MLELILVRHAKSDWADLRITDHDRPLNERGGHDAPMMAARLAESGAIVDRILSSTAVRARTTAAHFGAALGVEVELDTGLYLAQAPAMLAKASGSGVDRVMIVTHDPGISDLAAQLSGGGIDHMPTCAVARFTWRTEFWSGAADRAENWSFDTPRGPRA